jgi:hypothetical protein
MRRHKIVTWSLFILFIVDQVVNFVFGAPVPTARKKLEGHIDMDGTEDGTAALQKRVNPMDEGSTNMAGETPPSPDKTEVDQLWQEMRKQGILIDSPTPLHIPGWSTPPYSQGSSTGSIDGPLLVSPEGTPLGPVAHNPSPPLHPMPLPEDRPPLASSLTTDTLSTTGHQPTPQQNLQPAQTLQQSLGPDSDTYLPPNTLQPEPNLEPHPPPAVEVPIDDFLEMLMEGKIKRTYSAPVL